MIETRLADVADLEVLDRLHVLLDRVGDLAQGLEPRPGAWCGTTPRTRRRPRPPPRRRRPASLAATSSSSSPVAGLRTSSVFPDFAARHVPPMKFSSGHDAFLRVRRVVRGPFLMAASQPSAHVATMLAGKRRSEQGIRAETLRSRRLPCAGVDSRENVRPGDGRDAIAPCVGGDTTLDEVIRLEHVSKRFGQFVAVHEADFGIGRGEFFSMLGPSGCGKTTTLRMIAGFEQPTSGAIRLEDQDVSRVPPYKRNVNTVFQHYALFPHMSVWDNVAFGPKSKKVGGDEIKRRVGELLEVVRLADFAHRKPNQLSGGQQQRVALARALVELPERAVARRAARGPRPEAAPGDAARTEAHPARGRHHVRVRDARPGRGAHDERPHRGHERGAGRADRHAATRSTTLRRRSSSPASSATRTCYQVSVVACADDVATVDVAGSPTRGAFGRRRGTCR